MHVYILVLQTVQLSVCVCREYSCQSVSPDSTAVSLCLQTVQLSVCVCRQYSCQSVSTVLSSRLRTSKKWYIYHVLPWASTCGPFKTVGTCMDKALYVLSCVSSLMVKRGKSVTQRKLSCSGSRLKCPDFDRTDATWVRISPRVFNWRTECEVEPCISRYGGRIWLGTRPSPLCLLTTLMINGPRPSSSVFARCEWSKTGWWERGWLILALGIND